MLVHELRNGSLLFPVNHHDHVKKTNIIGKWNVRPLNPVAPIDAIVVQLLASLLNGQRQLGIIRYVFLKLTS